MNAYPKYRPARSYNVAERVWPSRRIAVAPRFVPVDLRDGNQAFARPMNVETKIRYFKMLCAIGFKEIEVAYPAASSEEFEFVRRLIGENLIPADVRIAVFTAARADLIDRTVAAIAGADKVLIHCYIAASDLHRKFVFGKTREELTAIAVESTRRIADAVGQAGLRDCHYEFTPEEFSDSDVDYIVDLAEQVRAEWRPEHRNFTFNLPQTVERRGPYEYADMVELFCRNYSGTRDTVISVHTHNDQGCAVAAAEMAVMAGADRVEGTLCGHGERTGNMDIVTFALNLKSRGVEPGLDFSRLPEITAFVEEVSEIKVHPRMPYSGALVFTAFSGTHQDAIRKGMAQRGAISDYFQQGWKMPYIHLDPTDIGRNYDGLIRINSQSGKGGVAYVLESVHGIHVPGPMQRMVAQAVQAEAEASGDEITPEGVYRIFREKIVDRPGPAAIREFRIRRPADGKPDRTAVELTVAVDGAIYALQGEGAGPIEAAAAAFRQCPEIPPFQVEDYSEHALSRGADAQAIAFVGLQFADSSAIVYGAGIDVNINLAAIRAMVNAVNRRRQT